jgi:hypothetical protein
MKIRTVSKLPEFDPAKAMLCSWGKRHLLLLAGENTKASVQF